MKKIFEEHGSIPSIKEWRKLGRISADAILRAFGTWTKAWQAAGLLSSEGPVYQIKEKMIIEIQKAFIEYKKAGEAFGVQELVRASGHSRPTVVKYFGSVSNLLSAAKIDINKQITKDDLINDFLATHKKLSRIPTAKDIENNCEHAKSTFLRVFGSLDAVISAAGLEKPEVKDGLSDDELLEDLKRLHAELSHTPTNEDIMIHGKFSPNAYSRNFGSFSNALAKIGLSAATQTKSNQVCRVCGINTVSMISHVSKDHPEEFKKQEQSVVELYRSGLSSKKICARDDHIFISSTSVARIIKKYTTAEERELLRKQKIETTLKKDYADGKYNWVNELNSNRNISSEARQKNSDGLKEAYLSGDREPWNKGATKETDPRLALAAINTSISMKTLFKAGEIDKKIGPESSRWIEDRGKVAKRYRLGLSFNYEERSNIKKRANYCCQHCGISQEQLEESNQTLECDHIIAITDGGLRDWETNGQALCPICHLKKTASDAERSK